MQAETLQRDLVLVGGGHAHVIALKMLAMNPVAGLRVTLVSLDSHSPYSGMLPGLVAGHYNFDDAHIDLVRLCGWAGARFIRARATGLDPDRRRVLLADREALAYDIVSLDTGSEPELDTIPGAREHAVPVKPVHNFWQRWLDQDQSGRQVVVGGGAGGVEIALAMAQAQRDKSVAVHIVCAGELLPGYNQRARRAAYAACAALGVECHEHRRVDRVSDGALHLSGEAPFPFDHLFWCTSAAPGKWLAGSGLRLDQAGFVAIRDTLQSESHDNVFAVGDVATQSNHPRPKAGVFAVRQGPVLAHNLAAYALGETLRDHHPQRRFLSLVSLGEQRAVADKGVFTASGGWVWRWKDSIDRQFMRRFSDLPPMPTRPGRELADSKVQAPCGGCGAKVGADALSAALSALAGRYPQLCPTPSEGDDGALLAVSADTAIVQSVDLLRELVSDPFQMGRITAQHALSDLFACGARPHSAQAMVILPFASDAIQRHDLQQLLGGALFEFARYHCRLLGGHSMQGPELNLGFVVNGELPANAAPLSKHTLRPGDRLILTRPLGTGVIFAAHMQHATDGHVVTQATEHLLGSNDRAGDIAREWPCTAATDITGFGLVGHLLEMLGAELTAVLNPHALPTLPGAMALLQQGFRGSAHPANLSRVQPALADEWNPQGAEVALMCDAQTGGGLLLGVAAEESDALLQHLREAGYGQASCIGEVRAREGSALVRAAAPV